ncbi:hypothetical protein KP509_18G017800 [Ceratopteris richardii]|uniref:Uncharacterized protein n=2 Tax=Ceratopteris richardii TaxID=49495 RepID=A0A8T2SRJ5_CERRI|nr:hypothetical protein KP509_18G017800 [Ceratopteris richardii]KAH7365267.1 hypothetical protein KP509_18G017800 [Ceratopteris richardii]KAH7365268.1 hypothetical protein KP509_18G017800 [Ceratopteris richardii]KAH7365269.1 hypothetical protein KP509_18G017800 [Ceratopteris richardii]KAH7365270.1 hypothetical protein KP509_18G017800 [Ceratopteris richardii]
MPYFPVTNEDEEDDDLLLESCQKDLEALKKACNIDCNDESGDEEERSRLEDAASDEDDDDLLLSSIQKKFGVSGAGEKIAYSTDDAEECADYAEECDGDILRAVQERFSQPACKEDRVKLDKCGTRSKSTCSLQESTTSLSGSTSVIEEQRPDCNVQGQLSEQYGSQLSGEADHTLNECRVTVSDKTACETFSPLHNALETSSLVHDSEQTSFHPPKQIGDADGITEEIFHGPVCDNVPQTEPSDDCPNQSLQSILDVLKKNRLSQRVLVQKLEFLKLKLKENRDLKQQLRALLDFQKISKKKHAFTDEDSASDDENTKGRRISVQRMSDECVQRAKCRPPENPDVAKFMLMREKFCPTLEPKPWTKEERIELVKGVEQQVQESRIRSLMDTYSNTDADFLDDQVRGIAEDRPTPEDIRKALPTINWNEVARVYVVGRSPTECWIQWSNHEDSLINHGSWTKAEDKNLWSIVKQHKLSNWDHISQALGSRRTISQCLVRYQRSLNSGIMRGAWTQEEDEQLRAAVQKYGDQDWLSISAALEGRTGPQCWNRWHKVLNPIRQKSGRWSVTEDKRLRLAVSVYGPRMWKKIAVHIPGRTEVQCRERWCNILDPSLTLADWTSEEDQRLEAAVRKYGSHRWAAVASELKPRTDNQCWRRWKFLHPELLSDFQKDNKIQRAALISNFVGRKRERSKLGPSDFVPEPGAFGTNMVAYQQDGALSQLLSTQEISKRRRLERLEKLREARATRKMLPPKQPSTVRTSKAEKHKNLAQQKKKQSMEKSRGNPNKNGTAAFVKAMHELAKICEERDKNKRFSMSLVDSSSKGNKLTEEESSTSHIDVADVLEDGQIEAAARALVSWPFVWAMQDLLDKAS